MNLGDTVGCWQVLFPGSTTNISKRMTVRWCCWEFRGTKILLLSDLSRAGQSALLARTNDLHADIVVAACRTEASRCATR